MDIRLTPGGRLRWETDDDGAEPKELQTAIDTDWREALFILAAERSRADRTPGLVFWQQLAERFLAALCHIPEGALNTSPEAPAPADCASWVLAAPPMQGGEYLSEETILHVWNELDRWVQEAIEGGGAELAEFLSERAPKWRQVGKICFHLAENRRDETRPFAFMATCIAGFNSNGQPRHVPLQKALDQHAQSRNRAALLRLLQPVAEAQKLCPWLDRLVKSDEIYHPAAWSTERAYQLLQSVENLEECGLSVRLPNWWRRRARPQVSVKIGSDREAAFNASALLDFNVQVALGDETLTEQELRDLLDGDDGLVLFKGQWIEVNREKLQEALSHWEKLREEADARGGVSFIEGMRLLAGTPADLVGDSLPEDNRVWTLVEPGPVLQQVMERLRQPESSEGGHGVEDLKGVLRPYQHQGLEWLHFVTGLGLGACLADDMGLGKTIQILALLLRLRHEQPGPSLLVVPASLIGNWQSEVSKFAPSLNLRILHPSETRREDLGSIASDPECHLSACDLVVTTYAMAMRQPWLASLQWNLVILDEAQAIKNPATRQSRAVRSFHARARIVLTGTPVENSLGDLWALFDFVNPGLLGSRKDFDRFVGKLAQRKSNSYAPLRSLVAPYILRRLKTDRRIVPDLPDKTEVTRFCHLSRAQVRLYEQVVRHMEDVLKKAEGAQRLGVVLSTLMRLKQICNHPCQARGDGDWKLSDSGKFQCLKEICQELAERQERVLVFTQFREIIDPVSWLLEETFGRRGMILHGETGVRRRSEIVEQFQYEDGPPFLILSLRAGGTGLNLTAASHVIHFDRWWNPAVENQATDRAFRIGQKRNVLVHKFVTTGTVEERVDEMIAQKQELADEILTSDKEINLTRLSNEEVLDLVRLDLSRAEG